MHACACNDNNIYNGCSLIIVIYISQQCTNKKERRTAGACACLEPCIFVEGSPTIEGRALFFLKIEFLVIINQIKSKKNSQRLIPPFAKNEREKGNERKSQTDIR